MEKWKYCHDKDFDAADADSEKGEEEIEVEFISNYSEEDIVDLFNIASRECVAQRSADHLCKIRMKAAFENKKNFKWPVLRGYPHFFKNVKML